MNNVPSLLRLMDMNQKAEHLYNAMLQDMEYCRHQGLGRGMELECLFNICNRYRAIVQSEVAGYVFETEMEEIIFFKTIKPKFVSKKIYCSLLAHARLFKKGSPDKAALLRFWSKEK